MLLVEGITQKKGMQDREHGLLETLELVTNQMAAAVTRCSRDFRYIWLNQGYADWLQRPRDEIVGRRIVDVLGKDAFESLMKYFERVLAGENVSYEEEVGFRGIGKRWISATYRPTFDARGVVSGWVAVVIDITDRRRAEESIKESEQRFRLVADTAPVLIWMSGTDKLCNYFNKPWLDFTGRSFEEESGNGWAEGVHPADRHHCLETYTQSFGRREKFKMEYRLRRRDGEYRWILDIGVPRSNQDCSFAGYIGIGVDVTEQKMAQEALSELNRTLEGQTTALQAREELLKIFVKNVPAGVAMLDRDMRYLQVSDRWCADYSVLDSSQMLGRSHYELFPNIPERWKEVHRRALNGETVRAEEDCWDREDGTTWVHWEVRPWLNVDGLPGGILIFAEDITRRKQMEEALSDMSRKLIESQEQERSRIGRELHDDINQRLAVLAMDLEQLQDNPSHVQSRARKLHQLTVEISNDVQALSHELHSSKLEYLGVIAGIKSWCREFADRQRLEIDFKNDVSSVLPFEVGLCFFRVLQEALHNAVKHSGVKRLEVQLAERSNEIHLIIHDSGKGFDLEEATQQGGLGLTSMRERVRLVNGDMEIQSKPMGGTTIHVRVPIRPEHASQRAAG